MRTDRQPDQHRALEGHLGVDDLLRIGAVPAHVHVDLHTGPDEPDREGPWAVDRKIKRLRSLTADIDNVYFNIKSERHSYYQALLSLGDRRVAPAIEAAERNGGNWRAAVAESGVDADFYIFRDRSADGVLPWDIIDGGMKSQFFRAEFDKGLREEWTLPPKRAAENRKFLPVLS